MKKFTFLLVAAIFAAMFNANAQGVVASGNCGAQGDNLTWEITGSQLNNRTLTISGTGDMADFSGTSVPWFSYSGNIKTVIINDGVTSIGNSAFVNCTNLPSINIPDGVTTIGNAAFQYCTNLLSINIPSSVTAIGTHAFATCGKLSSVTIPNGVTAIENSTFMGCSLLSSVSIPGSVKSIGLSAFNQCNALTSLIIPEGVETIDNAFQGCTLLSSVNIPSSVTSMAGSVFNGCGNLTSVTLNGLTPPTLGGGYVFYNTNAALAITVPCGSLSQYQGGNIGVIWQTEWLPLIIAMK
ncbi:MAG: leucine-rich repeat domain-containing protein [Prevotellaceae bacterium]|jgi:hypothetical protein|nr:leucine-rich repeat domain-containing protein [Prevotellaceae bacterium]